MVVMSDMAGQTLQEEDQFCILPTNVDYFNAPFRASLSRAPIGIGNDSNWLG
jgi:hypothetical protein